MPDNTLLSQYWCARHWEPYANPLVADPAIDGRINKLVPQFVFTLPRFRKGIQMLMETRGLSAKNAGTLLVADWIKAAGKPMCCILGDMTMNDLMRRARAGQETLDPPQRTTIQRKPGSLIIGHPNRIVRTNEND